MQFLHIEQITPELTWRLRRDELYPGEYLFNMEMPEDDGGVHFGGFIDDQLIAVVSLFRDGFNFQFRKLAVRNDEQGNGYGNLLLAYITNFAADEGGIRLWCNARENAVGFYTKNGFISTGENFERKGINFVVMEKKIP